MRKLVILAAMAFIISVGRVADANTCAQKGVLLKDFFGGSMNIATCFVGLNNGSYDSDYKCRSTSDNGI